MTCEPASTSAISIGIRVVHEKLYSRLSSPAVNSDTIDIVRRLCEMPPSDSSLPDLNRICKKIEISRRPCRQYATDWSSLHGAAELSPGQWAVIATALILLADGFLSRETLRPVGLKCLNAALKAFDQWQIGSPPNDNCYRCSVAEYLATLCLQAGQRGLNRSSAGAPVV